MISFLALVSLASCSGRSDTVTVPAGEFLMGSDREDIRREGLRYGFPTPWFEDERPARKVNLPAFEIDRHEVTAKEYRRFTEATRHRTPSGWLNGTYPSGTGDYPVVDVDWYEASDYCRWAGKRLPTEEEWEKAARGTDGRLYPWGNVFDPAHANIAPDPAISGRPVPVGGYPSGKSPYGVDDMIGNVWEWTDSWYLPYPGNGQYNPNFGMKQRVVRGLSFNPVGHYPKEVYAKVLAVFARASARSYEPPSVLLEDLGFRCAKSASS